MIIRKAEEKDWQIIQSLNNEVFIHDKEFDEDLDLKWPFSKEGINYYKNLASDKNLLCFIVEIENEYVGYLAVSFKEIPYRKGKYLEVDNMGVLPKYRSKGIGKTLIKHVKEWAKEKKVTKIYVSAYYKNKKAIEFYKREGFQLIDIGLESKI